MNSLVPKVIFGTANCGCHSYGVLSRGVISDSDISAMFDLARASGILKLDCAEAYGANERIKRYLSCDNEIDYKINFKRLVGIADRLAIREVKSWLSSFPAGSIRSIMIHDYEALNISERHIALQRLREWAPNFGAQEVGVSIYDPALICRDQNIRDVDVVQVPSSLLDQRLKGVLETGCAESIKRIVIRSIFLQGLLLDPISLKIRFKARGLELDAELVDSQLLSFKLAVEWAKSLMLLRANVEVVAGFQNDAQLRDFCNQICCKSPDIDFSRFRADELNIIDPRRW